MDKIINESEPVERKLPRDMITINCTSAYHVKDMHELYEKVWYGHSYIRTKEF